MCRHSSSNLSLSLDLVSSSVATAKAKIALRMCVSDTFTPYPGLYRWAAQIPYLL
jgi:hypothetical protein